MLSVPNRGPVPSLEPLTHADYLAMCERRPAAAERFGLARVQVQCWHPDGPVTLCGMVLALHVSRDGGELFKVKTAIDDLWLDGRRVRMCSHDGRCPCACEPGGRR